MPDASLDPAIERAARRVRARSTASLWWSSAWGHVALALAVCASAALLARFFLGWTPARAALLLAPALGVPLWSWRRALARAPGLQACVAWLDLGSGGSGRVMVGASSAHGDAWGAAAGDWLREHQPRFAALPLRAAWPLAPALAFALAVLVVPVRPFQIARSSSVPPAAIESLHGELEALASTDLSSAEVEQIRERLERIEELAAAGEAESAWEALDSVEQMLGDRAEEATESLVDAAASLEAIADGSSFGAAAEAELSGLAAELGLESPAATPNSGAAGASLDGALPEQARDLLAQLEKRMGALGASGLIDPSQLQNRRDGARRKSHKHDATCEAGGT
ncbi:MAG: hypothetical protein EPO68_18195 [Planctomycetota bacterium]|nr:MAG: hypothetical protein EPO68_18195 [Planctomycetota bacterium]